MRRKVFIALIIAISLTVIGVFMLREKVGIGASTLTIKNHSGEILKNATLTYNMFDSDKVIDIGDINDKETYKHKIDDSTAESSIILSFVDDQGEVHSEVVVGYVFKGVSSVQVNITKEDNQFVFTEQ